MTDMKNQYCSFCGKSTLEVKKLISGNDANICDECVSACKNALDTDNKIYSDINLSTPIEINTYLNQYIIGQEFSKKILSVAVYNHYKRLKYIKEKREKSNDKNDFNILTKGNILLIGPTGSGKTLLAETLAHILNVPFAMADATTLTEAGYVGDDVESIIQKLVQNSNFDIAKTESGIIYIDEIDKIARKSDSPSITRDVSGEGVQQALLKIIEGTVASIPPQGGRKHPHQEYLNINTRNILFICGGAFDGLEKIISSRIEKSSIGFNAELFENEKKKNTERLFKYLEPEDLIKYGLIPEFVGRLPIVSTLNNLDENDLVRILSEPRNSLTKQYQILFGMENVEIDFHSEALKIIAKKAITKKSGARGLRSILESILLDIMYHLPSKQNVKKIIINEDVAKRKIDPIIEY